MKNIYLLATVMSLLIIFIFSKCEWLYEDKYLMFYENNSEAPICLYEATGGIGGVYSDTTLSMDSVLVEKRRFEAGEKLSKEFGLPIEKRILYLPKDTLSIYIFSADTLSKYSWSQIQDDYKILCRYDLSIKDIHHLNYTITYPPTEAMRNIQMYPPYKE